MTAQPARLTGVLVVDKPPGMTSHDVVDRVRDAVGHRKVGHTGTLDPAATGVLVCCLGRATRLVRFLQTGRKTYDATMVLGVETTTQDAEGDVVAETDASHVDERAFCEALMRLRGDIEQTPPMVSAVRVDGERLHERARRGEVVEREPRSVTVHDLVLDRYDPGPHPVASFLVTCSPGTYVRTLAHDVGRDLGVGGSLTGLRRIANGPFTVEEAHGLEAIASAGEDGTLEELVLSMHDATVRVLPVVTVDSADAARDLTHGKPLDAQEIDGPYAVVFHHRLVGIFADRDGQGRAEAVLLRPEEVVTEA